MTDSEFATLSEGVLDRIESAFESSGLDLDIERKGGGILELDLPGLGVVVVNSQAPMRQIWVASRSGAHHFAMREDDWTDTRSGERLFDLLGRLTGENCGQAVRFERQG